jgi:Xaa-Pro aminopeptidase
MPFTEKTLCHLKYFAGEDSNRRTIMNISEKLRKIRNLMQKNDTDAYIIPTADPHQSEYLTEYWKIREWASGFTGSAGSLVITKDEAGLWTDGRYFLQAESELRDSEISLFKSGEKGVPEILEWLLEKLDKGSSVGLDGLLYSAKQIINMKSKLWKKEIKLIDNQDFIGPIWGTRPEMPVGKVFSHALEYSGESCESKIERVRKVMEENQTSAYIVTALDDIAWVYNIRGHDIEFNPVVISYALITEDKAFLFVDSEKLDLKTREQLEKCGVEILDYELIYEYIEALRHTSIYLDSSKVNSYIYSLIDESVERVEKDDIITNLKAIKNEVEIKNYRICQLRDGIAMVKSLFWIEKEVGNGKLTELLVASRINSNRAEYEEYIEPSFETMVAFKDHGAIVHYHADSEYEYEISGSGLILIDSGGQYLDGTTDITRTISIGKPNLEEIEDYTSVLKGHIALSEAVFPYGATGSQIDCIARMNLWKEGKDYRHGTGHGVGYLLSVHEGPQRISPFPNDVILEENMLVTNEPGFYREGVHGIRIENILLLKQKKETSYGRFLGFEIMTLCPLELELMDFSRLDESEIKWVNDYHKRVCKEISPYLNEEMTDWLKYKTRKIEN